MSAFQSFAKEAVLRSEPYRRYVASCECFGCGLEGWSQCAHPNSAKYGKGLSRKAGDQYCFPLCAPRYGMPGCHFQFDQCIDMSLEDRIELEGKYISRMQARAIADGRKEIR